MTDPLLLAQLSVQRALLGVVTSDLRAVTVTHEPQVIEVRLVYEDDPSQDVRELIDDAHTEVIADFPVDTDVRFMVVVIPPERPLSNVPGDRWLYLRKER